MAVIQSATSTAIATVDPTFRSMRTTIKPDEMIGAYHINATSGLIAATAANSPLFSFRWAPGSGRLCVVKRVSISITTTTGPTAAQQMSWGLFQSRGSLTSDSGGTALAPLAGNTNKQRTKVDSSQMTDIRIASTGTLTAGTRTLDTQPLARVDAFIGATTAGVGTTLINTNLVSYNINDYPIVLENNAGIVITNILASVVMVYRMTVNVEWFETEAYRESV